MRTHDIAASDMRRITRHELDTGIRENLGITTQQFARLAGLNPRRVRSWLSGEETDIPPYVPILLALLELPGGSEAASAVAVELSGARVLRSVRV